MAIKTDQEIRHDLILKALEVNPASEVAELLEAGKFDTMFRFVKEGETHELKEGIQTK